MPKNRKGGAHLTLWLLNGLSMTDHFQDFTRGVVDTSHIVYYITLAAVFLFLTVRSLETRRWA